MFIECVKNFVHHTPPKLIVVVKHIGQKDNRQTMQKQSYQYVGIVQKRRSEALNVCVVWYFSRTRKKIQRKLGVRTLNQ